MAVNRKPVKGSKKLAHKTKAKTPRQRRNTRDRIVREALISDLKSTIYAANARSMVKKVNGLRKTG